MAKIRDKNRSKNPKTHSSVRDRPIVSIQAVKSLWVDHYTVNNYMQVTGIATGENFAFFIYRHFVEIL